MLEIRPDTIKLDGSYTRNLPDDEQAAGVIRAAVRFSEDIGAQTVAKQIQTKEAYESVKNLGTTYAQGYLIGRPTETPES